MSSLAKTHPGNPRSNETMPGLSARAQALLAPRHHPQFTRAVPMPDAALCWPGTQIKRSTDTGFTRPAGPSVMAPTRTARELAADEAKRSVYLADDKKPRKPRKTVAELLAPARNPIRIDGPTEAAKQARIKRVKF